MPSDTSDGLFGTRIRELCDRLAPKGKSGVSAMAKLLGVDYQRVRTWTLGSRPPEPVLRDLMLRLGVAETDRLADWLLDTTGRVTPPSWWGLSGPPPKDPTLLYLAPPDPPKPWDPAPLPPDVQARVDADLAAAEARLAGKPQPAATVGPARSRPPLKRVRDLALAAFDAQVDGDEAGVERALSEIRALVCVRGGGA